MGREMMTKIEDKRCQALHQEQQEKRERKQMCMNLAEFWKQQINKREQTIVQERMKKKKEEAKELQSLQELLL